MLRTPRTGRRPLVEQAHSIDVRRLKRNGEITSGDAAIMLCLVTAGQSCMVRLVHQDRPVFGGVRTYFCCPECDRRCDLLYVHPHIACRRCHGLAFASVSQSRVGRALQRLHKQRERLGQTQSGLIAPFPGKRKWRRWPRYLRARREALRMERRYWQDVWRAAVARNHPAKV